MVRHILQQLRLRLMGALHSFICIYCGRKFYSYYSKQKNCGSEKCYKEYTKKNREEAKERRKEMMKEIKETGLRGKMYLVDTCKCGEEYYPGGTGEGLCDNCIWQRYSQASRNIIK